MGFKEISLRCSKKFDLGSRMSQVPQSYENNDISANAKENVDFPTVGENIYRSIMAIKQPLTGRNRRGRGRCID
jgi:hypothetical protein